MFKIVIFMCCCAVSLTACVSSSSASTAKQLFSEKNMHVSMQRPAHFPVVRLSEQNQIALISGTSERLLSELAQAVEVYDIHKAFALFAAIDEANSSTADYETRAAARASIAPLLALISLERLSEPAPVTAGSAFDQPFTIRAVVTTPERQFPLDNYPLTVSYPSGKEGIMKIETVYTDSEGFLYFTPPVPERATDGVLRFYLSISQKDAAAADIPENLCAVFSFKAATREKRVPTIIAILDYDENNQPIFSTNITATRLLTGLMKRGFGRIGLDEYEELAGSDETQVIRAAQIKIGSVVERFIFGKTAIELETTERNTVSCRIQADISVWDFKKTQKTKHFTFEYTAEAKTKAQAISSARTALGESVIAEAFTYNL